MNLQIRPLVDDDLEAVVQLSLRAWEPVFASFRQVLGNRIFLQIYPDWIREQRAAVKAGCQAPAVVWVADVDGSVAGFITYKLDHEKKHGEVEFLAVDPAYQNRGIGTALNAFVLGKMRESGMTLAEVGTGGDPGHAPARRSYEKAGYIALPIVRYYQDLTGDE
jgi:ribosomal protein S18 acetylase RimI-like enzyme